MAKISEVFQKPDESPAAFYERLCEAYRIYTPFNPEAPDTQPMVNAAFVGQAQPDIRRKLQKLEGFEGKNASELLEITNKVFINRDSVARRGERKENTKKGQCDSSGFRGSGLQTAQKGKQEYRPGLKGRASLRRDQSAYCKETGHWKNECPKGQSCPVPLMGRDFLAKMETEITFAPDGSAQLHLSEETSPMILSLAVPREEEWRLYAPQSKASSLEPGLEEEFPLVWAEGNPPGLAKDHAPILIDLKPGAQPVKICQYLIPREARLGIQVHLDRLLQWGLLKRCQSPWNTPLLPVKKPGTNDYRMVQDLRAINEAVITLHLALPNPSTLLGLIPSEVEWFTCLDLKDALSSPFCFEWLQSVQEKAQICQKEVKYLGFRITQGKRRLGPERKQAVCAIPVPSTWRQIREFLGAAGFCRIWIPGCSDLAKPLCEALKGEEKAPIEWGPEQEKAFISIKAKLTEASALGLPDVTRDFNLFIHENSGVAQDFGPWRRPVACLSKQIDPVGSGWPRVSGPLQPRHC
ncbi:hypothetical protein QTO34_004250 [Cnephaeus nilssonii]|uniref:Core shell protein Gag P30 domain-containing protein n=1 Tax=Cnephaeus nilssonii TaxID=3371016 RepID=A0AA40HSC6_CNENI|nr:hypothetical protein QTO34_004250 [Eptesicus nilssonii]